MSEQPWQTHHQRCINRRSGVSYPRHACRECMAIEAAEKDMLARCIAAVEALPGTGTHVLGLGMTLGRKQVLTALRGLGGSDE